MRKIVILGGGAAGFTVAAELERKIANTAHVTLVDQRAHMVYQPFLAEVASGSIEPRHVEIPYHQHLRRTEIACAQVMGISAAKHEVYLQNLDGDDWTLGYDTLVVTLGAVTKTFPTPGIAENAIGMKSVEEAVHVRNQIIMNFNRVSSMYPDNPERKRLLTFVVVGGGFSGVESFGEMINLAHELLRYYPAVDPAELSFHLIEAADHIMPELPRERSQWVIDRLERRGGHVHLNTFVESAEDGVVRTSAGDAFRTEVIVWTAGSLANPVLKHSDLPLDERGRLRCRTDLRVCGDDGIVPDVWGAGDATHVADTSGCGLPDGSCAPTAQHAIRQARCLVNNIVASYEGRRLTDYYHPNAGMVAGLGEGLGVFTDGSKKLGVNGLLGWLAHRAYHVSALPTAERKARVISDWVRGAVLGRDLASTSEFANPRGLFEKYAARTEEKKGAA
ncbi:MAG: NAD(P)/FAD-dependent oxidoreductase [Eggerthellaceae bacterium]|jgi:NADH dehydrogenase